MLDQRKYRSAPCILAIGKRERNPQKPMKAVIKKAIVCSALAVSLWGLSARATVTFVGIDTNTGSAWRTPSVAKANDVDGDNIYGSDGFWLPTASIFAYTSPYLNGGDVITTNTIGIDALPGYILDLQFANAEQGASWGGGPNADEGTMDLVAGSIGFADSLVPIETNAAFATNLNLSLVCSNAPAFRLTLIFGNDPNALGFFETSILGGNTDIPNLDDPQGMYVTVNDGSGAVSELSGTTNLAGVTNGYLTYQSWDISAGATNISINIGLNGTSNTVARLSGIAIDALPVTRPTFLVAPSGGGNYYQGHPFVLNATGGGAFLKYQWLFNSNVITNATNYSYSIASATTNNTGNYQVVLTNSAGSVTSSVLAVTVLAPPITVIYQDEFSTAGVLAGRHPDTVDSNNNAWTASAIWNTDGTNMVATGVVTGNAFLPFVPQPGRVYTLQATIQDTTTDAGSWTAMGFANGTNTGAQWHTQNAPVGWTLIRGNYPTGNSGNENQTFIGPGTGGGVGAFYPTNFTTYQVIFDTTPTNPANWTFTFTENGNVLRAATAFGGSGPTISYVGIGLINGGSSATQVSDVQNFTLSQQVPFAAPFYTTQPSGGGTVFVGENRTLTAVVGGSDPLTYQWKKNSVNILNATNTTLVLTNLQVTNSGTYQLVAYNPLDPGGSNSTAVTLAVVTPVVTTNYLDYFTHFAINLNGNSPDTVGTNQVWIADSAGSWYDDGTEAGASPAVGVSADAFLPFVPQAGHLYSLSANIDCTSGSWIALGFANGTNASATWQNTGSTNNTPVGWELARVDNGGACQTFVGTGTAGSTTAALAPTGGLHNYQVLLDTRPTNASAWTFTFLMDSNNVAGPTAFGGSGPTISSVGLGSYQGSVGVVQTFLLQAETAPVSAVLHLAEQAGSVVLSWPTSYTGYSLQGSLVLGANASWQSVGGTPTVVNGTNQVTLSPTNHSQYFRLVQ
jgi:hypothetical protein